MSVDYVFLDEIRRFYEIERLYRENAVDDPVESDGAPGANEGLAVVRSSLTELLATRPVRWPTARPGTTTSRWARSWESRRSSGTSSVPNRAGLHQRFVDAGADIILTNTFGCNRNRLGCTR